MTRLVPGTVSVLAALALATGPADAEDPDRRHARNVIVLIGDGAGYNTWKISAMFDGTTGASFYDAPGWTHVAASTHALRQSRRLKEDGADPLAQDESLVYDPARAWDTTPATGDRDGFPLCFEGYRWLLRAPDSANTATTISTGLKTYRGAINVDGAKTPIRDTLAQLSKDSGRRVGVVSSVPFSHATPAVFGGAHSPTRSDYPRIARDMLTSRILDVIAGAGNPDFDHNGAPLEDPAGREYKYVGGPDTWMRLGGRADGRAAPAASWTDPLTAEEAAALEEWTLVQSLPDIEALVEGDAPDRLLMVPQVGQARFWKGRMGSNGDSLTTSMGATLQQDRGSRGAPRYTPPGYDPLSPGIPSLATLTRAALNALDDDADGFFLMVEGGAVDWAMHGNQVGRMIEEMADFQDAIDAVLAWVENESSWDETIVLVTADHDHLLWGPDARKVPFDPVRDGGKGCLPGYRWLNDSHSAALVPVFARGVGSDLLLRRAVGRDPRRGPYLDQADLFVVLRGLL